MKLVAMVMARNEADRYLQWTIPALHEFCDEVRVVDDCSTDGTHAILTELGCVVHRNDRPRFFEHEGRARNFLLDWTLQAQPTHILAIDCDEIVADGQLLRQAAEQRTSPAGVWNLTMEEVWAADDEHLWERVDGQWGSRKVPILFEIPARRGGQWRIADRALACGREPMAVAKAGIRLRRPEPLCPVFHLGWACKADRLARFERYVKHDNGAFHASTHLQSIMWEDDRVIVTPRRWPAALEPLKDGLLGRINR